MEERLNILGDNHPESDEYIKSCNELSQGKDFILVDDVDLT